MWDIERAPSRRGPAGPAIPWKGGRNAASLSALGLLVAILVIGAWQAFPTWDDGWLWLLLDESGPGAVAASFSDRPVNGALWGLLARAPGGLWPIAFLAQALLWLLFGLLAAGLWSKLFPRSRRLAPLVACLTVAPVWTKIQPVTVNVGLASLPSVVLGYAALLSLAAFVERGGRRGLACAAAGAVLLATGVLYEEYAVAVAAVGVVLLSPLLAPSGPAPVRRRAAAALAILCTVTASAYLGFVRLANYAARPDTDPRVAARTGRELLALPGELALALWRGGLGSALSAARQLLDTSAPAWLGLGLGAVLALLLLLGARDAAGLEPARARWRGATEIAMLAAATAAGLAPLLVMGRVPWDPGDGMTTRFVLPALPVLVALVVRTSEYLLPRRSWPVLVVAGALLAGDSAALEVGRNVAERRTLARLGAALEPRVEGNRGLTLAVVELPERSLGPRRQWELVGRMAARWPPPVRRRFWAYRLGGPPLYYREEAREVFGPRSGCRPPRHWRTAVRRVRRRGPVSELLHVAPGPDGAAQIEPYCRRPSPRSGRAEASP